MRRLLLSMGFAAAVAVAGVAGTTRDSQAVTNINLGFILDGSGSVGQANFDLARNALRDAISAHVPTNDPNFTYTIGVAVFGATGVVGLNKITINSAASKAAVIAGINTIAYGAGYSTGATCYNCAFTALNTAFGGGIGTGIGIVNMMTDGDNNTGGDPNNGILKGAGWDSLSFEAVAGPTLAPLVALGFDALGNGAPVIANSGLISDPLNNAFTLALANFGADYSAAISQKIQQTVIPLPAALPMLIAGIMVLGGFGVSRRRNVAMAA